MNILVFLRVARDPASFVVNRRAQKVFINREQHKFNPTDREALEAALRLLGPNDRLTVVALDDARFPGGAEDILRHARTVGAHRALVVSDPALARADAGVVVTVLQRVVDQMDGVDLVLLGEGVLDADHAQVGPRLAAVLSWPYIGSAHQVSYVDGGVQAVKTVNGGYHAFAADLPAVVSVARDSHKARYPRGAAIITTYKARDMVETLTLAQLQLTDADLEPCVEDRGESFPPERELGRLFEGPHDETAPQLAEVLRRA